MDDSFDYRKIVHYNRENRGDIRVLSRKASMQYASSNVASRKIKVLRLERTRPAFVVPVYRTFIKCLTQKHA